VKISLLPDLLSQEEILDRLEAAVVRPLSGWEIGTHYGCHYYRPAGTIMMTVQNLAFSTRLRTEKKTTQSSFQLRSKIAL